MNSQFLNGKKIGIIGGGQLAKMLSFSAQKMGAQAHIYSESSLDPAATTTAFHTKGPLTNFRKINRWLESLDVVTFESEFFDLTKLKLKDHAPNTMSMMTLRDRLSQKNLLDLFKVPTSPFSQPTKALLNELPQLNFKPQVLKQRLFGYDGYGTCVLKTKKSYTEFLRSTKNLNNWIQEDFIPFKRELAFSIARTSDNNFTILPIVETLQKNSKCFWVKGPVEDVKTKSLLTKIKKMLKRINYVGVIAFELFETQEGKLIVNEVAPRVHNSAHYSIEGLPLSQFDLHILAVFNQKLPKKVQPHKAFAMVNLIGSSKKAPKLKPFQNTTLHWYGKLDNRPGRKMGHFTVLDKTPTKALKSALNALKEQKL